MFHRIPPKKTQPKYAPMEFSGSKIPPLRHQQRWPVHRWSQGNSPLKTTSFYWAPAKMVVLYENTTCLKIGMTFLGMDKLWVSGSTDIAFVSISQKLTTKRNKIPQLKAVQKDANSQFSALDIDPDLCLQPAGENARSAHQWSDIFDTSARALKPWVLVSPSPVTVTEFLHF